ncbi:glycosyltransferase family 61 protein [Azospirillum rugosum]|uniref:EGF domain-specific O-linked N-acetylglucosamine transferase n=1 Tax=Azospirillum rugosum TaxID=416170 RepID=A0ABS4SR89_9PROT|nr:glycosyltransferase family 61 protein [Azospirillum rugosum]MBP2294457.1 capsular polysaccharide biosynthesis protein [Azospirillum rugosum]MDQ0528962.1 capsular polysaccharide biosynthesis protein [Azospirillum rugosum]
MTTRGSLPLPELEALDLVTEDGRPVVESVELLPSREVSIAPLAFGDRDFSARPVFERPYEGAWREERYRVDPVRLYRLRGAAVHSDCGIVMVKAFRRDSDEGWFLLLDETLQYLVPKEHGIEFHTDSGLISLQTNGKSRLPGRAVHLLAGGGSRNYYHWTMDVVSRLSVLPDACFDDLFLVPPLPQPYHWDMLASVAGDRAMRVQAVPNCETVELDELILIPNIGEFGARPRPEQLSVFGRVLSGVPTRPPHRRLYVTRRNAENRKLVNEEAIIGLLAAAGYEILDTDGMPLREQAQRFAEATHIVAAHGAGLTNLVYCDPSVSVCELQMDLYLNWLFRRIANLRGARYGCVVGETLGDWEPLRPHNKPWHVSFDRVKSTLAGAGFL